MCLTIVFMRKYFISGESFYSLKFQHFLQSHYAMSKIAHSTYLKRVLKTENTAMFAMHRDISLVT